MVPRAHRGGALAAEAGLRAEGGVLVELLGAVIGGEHRRKVVVPDVAAGRVAGLEGEAAAVADVGVTPLAQGVIDSSRRCS